MIWLIILIVILLGGIGYAAYRIWYLAGVLADAQEYIEELEVTNRYMYSKILESYDTMQRIDQKQAFEKDDDVGTTFQLLSEVLQQLKEQFDVEAQEEK
jgi:hypothetical protein